MPSGIENRGNSSSWTTEPAVQVIELAERQNLDDWAESTVAKGQQLNYLLIEFVHTCWMNNLIPFFLIPLFELAKLLILQLNCWNERKWVLSHFKISSNIWTKRKEFSLSLCLSGMRLIQGELSKLNYFLKHSTVLKQMRYFFAGGFVLIRCNSINLDERVSAAASPLSSLLNAGIVPVWLHQLAILNRYFLKFSVNNNV